MYGAQQVASRFPTILSGAWTAELFRHTRRFCQRRRVLLIVRTVQRQYCMCVFCCFVCVVLLYILCFLSINCVYNYKRNPDICLSLFSTITNPDMYIVSTATLNNTDTFEWTLSPKAVVLAVVSFWNVTISARLRQA